ncbi:Bactericidal permeability-increasing protein [Nibea albiflora]|uniref:Bactericidal permeability-increasing protein n=1 Tax=Nibea albiflora TaxID=240163 RepID=A0ACB7EYV5_NIBAL|nr:Bactericidal permeability-increasing protein [Nibea albiflora]
MFLCCWLALGALIPATFSINPGVKVELTRKGLEYGRQLGMVSIQRKLKTIKIPDFSGSQSVAHIGKVRYSLSDMQIDNVQLPQSAVDLVPGNGVRLSISNAFISLHGNWRVKYLKIIKDSGSFDLKVSGLTITTTIATKSDETGRPVVSSVNCSATVNSATIKFHHGASWLYNLFKKFISKALRKAMEKKGEFYNIGKHQEPPFSPTAFSMPPEINNMLYIGLSAFTTNSAAFVYNKAGALSLYITDDMLPKSSPIRLNTRTFGIVIPQIAKLFPGLMMKLLVKTVKTPIITFEPSNVTVQATASVTAYAIQPNGTLTPLFVLNLDSSVSAQVFVSGMRLAGTVTLNNMELTLGTSYVGEFQVKALYSIFQMVLKVVVLPKLNAQLAKGYPLPTLGKMKLVNTQLQVLKDYMLIGTDVQFKD